MTSRRTGTRAMLGALLVVAAIVAGPRAPAAWAQTADETRAAEAVALFEEGAEAFRKGDFALAVDRFKQAHALKRDPVLLYNLARAHEGLDDPHAALAYYRRYLAESTDPPDRGAVERRMAALQAEIKRRADLERREREPAPAPAPERAPLVAPWVMVGVGGAALLTGAVLGGLALAQERDAQKEPVAVPADELAQDARRLATAATVTLIAGAAITGGGLIWVIIDFASGSDVQIGVRDTGLSVRGTF